MFQELAVSLDAHAKFIVPGTVSRTMDPLSFILGESPLLRIRFYRNQALVGLPADFDLSMIVRRADRWSPNTNLAIQETWTEVQYSASDTYYEAELDIGLTAMTDYFAESRQKGRDVVGSLTLISASQGTVIVPFGGVVSKAA